MESLTYDFYWQIEHKELPIKHALVGLAMHKSKIPNPFHTSICLDNHIRKKLPANNSHEYHYYSTQFD